ncbi:hypothetical protein NH340_JMT02262 [Sarcoptes scabiei]|nr:hypothetical protein NH340_JMT02262 [Sarcoptes scabiei]
MMIALFSFRWLIIGTLIVNGLCDDLGSEENLNALDYSYRLPRNKRGGSDYFQQQKIDSPDDGDAVVNYTPKKSTKTYPSPSYSNQYRPKYYASVSDHKNVRSKPPSTTPPSSYYAYNRNNNGGENESKESPGPSTLYSYAPRRANSPLYGGIWGPQTDEEALKFDSHLTRSMIAEVIKSNRERQMKAKKTIPAAIRSNRDIKVFEVPSSEETIEPITIEVGASPSSKLNIKFTSVSSPLDVEQNHISLPGSVRETSSEDEPYRLVHTVTRPIYQEVHEVIKPFRKVRQEIQPVQEDIQTIVAKKDKIFDKEMQFVESGEEDSDEDSDNEHNQSTGNVFSTDTSNEISQGFYETTSPKSIEKLSTRSYQSDISHGYGKKSMNSNYLSNQSKVYYSPNENDQMKSKKLHQSNDNNGAYRSIVPMNNVPIVQTRTTYARRAAKSAR